MIIDKDLLLKYGAEYVEYSAQEVIYSKGDIPRYYFQIINGTVEQNNYHEDGKEFTLNILSDGQSLGESLLFGNKKYPMNAMAKTNCNVLKLLKSNFLQMLSENQTVVLSMFQFLSDRLFYKYIMLFNNSSLNPLSKIKSLMDYYKESSIFREPFAFCMPLTRQQIANLTGLRVETVIRTVKNMEQRNIIKIKNRQIYY